MHCFVQTSLKHPYTQTVTTRVLKLWHNVIRCHMSGVRCHMSGVTSNSQTLRAREMKILIKGLPPSTCLVTCVMCHLSPVTCHVSRVTCNLSHVICQLSHFTCYYLFGGGGNVVKLVVGWAVINEAYSTHF